MPDKGGNTRVLVASPDYLARHGQPDSVEELARRNGELFNRWRLFHQGQQREVTVNGDRAADDGALVRHSAVQGYGIAYKSRLDVEGDLQAGRPVDLFLDARGEPSPLYVAYPSRRYQPARIKVCWGTWRGVFG